MGGLKEGEAEQERRRVLPTPPFEDDAGRTHVSALVHTGCALLVYSFSHRVNVHVLVSILTVFACSCACVSGARLVCIH